MLLTVGEFGGKVNAVGPEGCFPSGSAVEVVETVEQKRSMFVECE